MKRIAIATDNWKVPAYVDAVTGAGFEYKTEAAEISMPELKGCTFIIIETDEVEKLTQVISLVASEVDKTGVKH